MKQGCHEMKRSQILFLVAIAVIVRLVACVIVPIDKKPWSDSAQYVNLGISLAKGGGYNLSEGNCWPGKPTIIRAPGWPLLLSMAYRVVPEGCRWKIAQALAVILDVVNVLLVMSLARIMGGSIIMAGVAGGLYAINPIMVGLCAQAGCEPAGVTFLLLYLCMAIGRWLPDLPRYALAGLSLGVACLIRTNWLVIAGFACVGVFWVFRRQVRHAIVMASVFWIAVMVPLMPWLVRNAIEFGQFPVFGAGGGETFYGGNNDLAADPRSPMWGYIVQPGGIPNEPALQVMAARMSEVEVDRYWMRRGWDWLRANPEKVPILVVGKLRRAFVPIPRNATSPMVLAASAYRAVIGGATIICVILLWRRRIRLRPEIWTNIGAVILATFATTVVFCGVMRYVIVMEILLVIPAAYMFSLGGKAMVKRFRFNHGT
jgi:hypothetical protein